MGTSERTREKTREKTGEKIITQMQTDPSFILKEMAERYGISQKGIE